MFLRERLRSVTFKFNFIPISKDNVSPCFSQYCRLLNVEAYFVTENHTVKVSGAELDETSVLTFGNIELYKSLTCCCSRLCVT